MQGHPYEEDDIDEDSMIHSEEDEEDESPTDMEDDDEEDHAAGVIDTTDEEVDVDVDDEEERAAHHLNGSHHHHPQAHPHHQQHHHPHHAHHNGHAQNDSVMEDVHNHNRNANTIVNGTHPNLNSQQQMQQQQQQRQQIHNQSQQPQRQQVENNNSNNNNNNNNNSSNNNNNSNSVEDNEPPLEGYERTNQIGRGAYGIVYKGIQRATNTTVAIKRIPFGDATPEGGVPCNVIREISLLRELDHPNVVKLLDVNQAQQGELYLVFEFVAHDLKTFMDRNQSSSDVSKRHGLDMRVVRSFLRQILEGVGFCHTYRILHRDLKPHNVSFVFVLFDHLLIE